MLKTCTGTHKRSRIEVKTRGLKRPLATVSWPERPTARSPNSSSAPLSSTASPYSVRPRNGASPKPSGSDKTRPVADLQNKAASRPAGWSRRTTWRTQLASPKRHRRTVATQQPEDGRVLALFDNLRRLQVRKGPAECHAKYLTSSRLHNHPFYIQQMLRFR
jgi:hypothetical protein